MKFCRQLFIISLLMMSSLPVSAEVITIENPNKSFFTSLPTLTFYMQGLNSKALILLLPGGDGMLFLKPDMTELNSGISPILKRLTDPSKTSGQYDVVAMDSPYSLKVSENGSGARGSSDHMGRIESAIRYFKEKTHLPIILMGHSNGTISIKEFVRYIQNNNRAGLLNGLILSSSRNEVDFSPPIDMPMVFMHHEQDACLRTLYFTDMNRYEKVKRFNKSPTSFIPITTGNQGGGGDECHGGFHMFFNADDEVSKKLDENLSKSIFLNH